LSAPGPDPNAIANANTGVVHHLQTTILLVLLGFFSFFVFVLFLRPTFAIPPHPSRPRRTSFTNITYNSDLKMQTRLL
jgi:hypothetical protein